MVADLLTVDAIKRLTDIGADNVADDDVLQLLIGAASSLVEQYTGRSFVPLWQTRRFDAHGDHITTTTLNVDRDLLEVSVLTNGDGVEIAPADYLLVPYDDYPKHAVSLRGTSIVTFTWEDDWRAAISAQGVWGYHEDWTHAWVDTLDTVQNNPLTAQATAITVANADGVDARGIAPRFEVLGYYRIENEVVQARSVNSVTNTLTVLRGVLGTTAVQHAQNTAISRYLVMGDIELAAQALTTWLYRNKDKMGERYQFLDGTQLVLNEAPKHIALTLNGYRRLRMG